MCTALTVDNPPIAANTHADLRKRDGKPKTIFSTTHTTLPWGNVPYTITHDNVVLIGVPITVASRTFYSTTTVDAGHEFELTISDVQHPIITIIAGVARMSQTPSTTSKQTPDPTGDTTSSLSHQTSLSSSSTLTSRASFGLPVTSSSATSSPEPTSAEAVNLQKSNPKLVVGLAVGIPLAVISIIVAFFIWRCRRVKSGGTRPTNSPTDSYTDYNQSLAGSKTQSTNVLEIPVGASVVSIIELDAPIIQQEVAGNQRYELDSAATELSSAKTSTYTPSAPGSAYIPYRRPEEDQLAPTSNAGIPTPVANASATTDGGGGHSGRAEFVIGK